MVTIDRDLLTTQEAAVKLRITRNRVRQLVKAGALPARRLGERGIYLLRDEDLEKLLQPVQPEPETIKEGSG